MSSTVSRDADLAPCMPGAGTESIQAAGPIIVHSDYCSGTITEMQEIL